MSEGLDHLVCGTGVKHEYYGFGVVRDVRNDGRVRVSFGNDRRLLMGHELVNVEVVRV